MNKEYLISNRTALHLYEYARTLPIIDYHNHLSMADLQSDRRFTDIHTLWIEPDPYKHRAMRMCGVEEKYTTGDAQPKEKFTRWCETLPKLLGNPLYIWSAEPRRNWKRLQPKSENPLGYVWCIPAMLPMNPP